MHSDTDGHRAPGGDHSARDKLQAAVPADPQDRDLVTACIYREQEAAVATQLDSALGRKAGASAGTAGRERRPRHWCKRPVGVTVEGPDRVGPGSVVVQVDMADDRRKAARHRPIEAIGAGRAAEQSAEDTGTAERGDAERKARGSIGVLSHRIRNLRRFSGGSSNGLSNPYLWRRPARRNDCMCPEGAGLGRPSRRLSCSPV